MANVGPKKSTKRLPAQTKTHNSTLQTVSLEPLASTDPLGQAHNIEVPVPPAFTSAGSRLRRKSSALSLAVTAVIVPGLFATVALPAYAFEPVADNSAAQASVALQEYKVADAQSVSVATDAAASAVARDAFTATTPEELQAAAAAAAAAARTTTASTGSGGGSGLANPPLPYFSLDAIVGVAMQYQGVPYASGGTTPAGFDCSGFVQYVYAQVGVGIPRTTGSQSAAGTRISRDAALPGDVVVMGGHNGIYLGNGMMIDSPVPGDVVGVHKIWTSNYTIVRFGI